jgi:hypothetical protein
VAGEKAEEVSSTGSASDAESPTNGLLELDRRRATKQRISARNQCWSGA